MFAIRRKILFFSCFLLMASVGNTQLVDLACTPACRSIMKDYFHQLSESVLDTFNAAKRISIQVSMQQLELDVDTAVPIGLISNELLTNAIKYAFAENMPGEILVSLIETGTNNGLVFRLSDNGIGKPDNNITKGTEFGTELVNLLVEQLEGALTVDASHGTSIANHFKNRKLH